MTDINNKSAEEKDKYVQDRVAYWPKSMVAKFSGVEEKVELIPGILEQHLKFADILDEIKKDIASIKKSK